MFQNITPITRVLLIINVVFFIVTTLFPSVLWYTAAYFSLSENFKLWQVVTHMFSHANFSHILFNMVSLWSFGTIIERVLGDKKFLTLYFLSGLGAFILYNAWSYVQYYQIMTTQYPSLEDMYTLQSILSTPMVGASGAIFGVLAVYVYLYPDSSMFIMFIPVPIKAKILFTIVILGSIYLGITSNGNIAHFAHLGGALSGYIMIKQWSKNRFRIK